MANKHKARWTRNGKTLPEFPLFTWADARERNTLPRPARIIAERYGLSASHALVVTGLAGFSMEHRQ